MRTALPAITEDGATLKRRFEPAHAGRKQLRLHRLYVLASGHAQTRQDVARLLGGHRYTVGHWLALCAAGGLEALLALDVPAGNPLSLALDVLGAIEQALQQPAGFASHEALRQWVQQTSHVEVNYHTLYTIVRTKFKAKLKAPGARHTKKP